MPRDSFLAEGAVQTEKGRVICPGGTVIEFDAPVGEEQEVFYGPLGPMKAFSMRPQIVAEGFGTPFWSEASFLIRVPEG